MTQDHGAVFALLKFADALPPALLGAMRVYIGIFVVYGILMIPCGWLPMYIAAGKQRVASSEWGLATAGVERRYSIEGLIR